MAHYGSESGETPSAPPYSPYPEGYNSFPAGYNPTPVDYSPAPPGFNPSESGYNMGIVSGQMLKGATEAEVMQDSAGVSSMEAGGDDGDDFAAFSEKSIRLGFIKKVFAILAVQLLITGGVMCAFVFWDDLSDWAARHQEVYIAACIANLVLAMVLICGNKIRRKFPINIICLLLYTLTQSWMLGSLAAYFSAEEILMAVGITLLVTIAMMCLGFQQKFDFTVLMGGMVVATFCLLGFGILCAIFRSNYGNLALAFAGAFIFAMWIVIDVQLMMGGNHKYSLNPEEYIFAALNLYLDIINLLYYILIIVASFKN